MLSEDENSLIEELEVNVDDSNKIQKRKTSTLNEQNQRRFKVRKG